MDSNDLLFVMFRKCSVNGHFPLEKTVTLFRHIYKQVFVNVADESPVMVIVHLMCLTTLRPSATDTRR